MQVRSSNPCSPVRWKRGRFLRSPTVNLEKASPQDDVEVNSGLPVSGLFSGGTRTFVRLPQVPLRANALRTHYCHPLGQVR
ncbi:hypothetical protein EKH55_5153 [Sinorhizobium alkalisoli]|nr:hypothetical protein EKH55_5153 [Sinorhizobium alkalisoli]